MTRRLRIGVMGAGSVGCFVGGTLLAANSADVVFVGRQRLQQEIAKHGLVLKNLEQPATRVSASCVVYKTDVEALADCDAVLCCVKSAQTAEVGVQLARVLSDGAVVISLQNGVRNAATLAQHLGERTVLAGIVGFNVVSRGNGLFHCAMSGSIMLQAVTDSKAGAVVDALAATSLQVEQVADLRAHQWTKLLINLNNAVSALSGAPTRELMRRPQYRRIVAAIIEEALAVLRASNIKPEKLRGIPVWLMPKILRLPTPIVRVVTRAQMKVDPEARSSMWEDLSKRRLTEVDFLNGEIVSLAERANVDAPINRRIVALVHEAEVDNKGSPGLDAHTLQRLLGV